MSDIDWFGIIGAGGGVFAVGWTLWRAYRERERVWVTFGALTEEDPSGHRELVAEIEVRNLGTLPTQIVSVQRVKRLPVGLRWPLRLMSFRTRGRWPIHQIMGRSRALFGGIPDSPTGVLPARQLVSHRVKGRGQDVERWIREHQWLVVSTALRWYVSRISDNRPPEPPDYDDAP